MRICAVSIRICTRGCIRFVFGVVPVIVVGAVPRFASGFVWGFV